MLFVGKSIVDETFAAELEAIKDKTIRGFVRQALNSAPEYFWRVSASSSGQHHPDFAKGWQGLVLHTKAAVRIFLEIVSTGHPCDNADACLAALLLHDTLKLGIPPSEETGTVADHPLLPEKYYARLKDMLPPAVWEAIFSRVRSHMGRWGPVMPVTGDEWLVHISDYLASREWVSEAVLL